MRRIVALIIACFTMVACDDNVYDRIPSYPVYLKLNIYTTGIDLVAIPSYLSYPKGTYTYDDSSLGYGGVLIVNGIDNVMRAYDLSCPVEARTTTLLKMDSDGLHATCPTCGSTFSVGDIDACGSPMEGEAREKLYFLRRYTVSSIQSTGYFYITN